MRRPIAYLAGPDVFTRDPGAIADQLRQICDEVGLEGSFPLDAVIQNPTGQSIYEANEQLIRGADGILAKLTPFRGPSADAGTIWEVGFARGLGKPVVGYTEAAGIFSERTVYWLGRIGSGLVTRPDGGLEDSDEMEVERFGLVDNLMIPGGIAASGGTVVLPQDAAKAGTSPARLAARFLATLLGVSSVRRTNPPHGEGEGSEGRTVVE